MTVELNELTVSDLQELIRDKKEKQRAEKKKVKGKAFSIWLRAEQEDWLENEAKKAGLSRSKFIETKIFPPELQLMINRPKK
jgi:hypothetical protein